jgi:hypothetical protein
VVDKFTINPNQISPMLPEVVSDNEERVDPKVVNAVMQIMQLRQTMKMNRHLEALERILSKRQFEGKAHSITLSATTVFQRYDCINNAPYKPLVSAFFINDGPSTVYIIINDSVNPLVLNTNETKTVDHSYADRRIENIYHYTKSGTASVRVDGHY